MKFVCSIFIDKHKWPTKFNAYFKILLINFVRKKLKILIFASESEAPGLSAY